MKPSLRNLSRVAAITFVAALVRAEEPHEALAQHIDALCAEWNKPDSPGCVVGVIVDGTLVFARGYGMANLEYALPITPESVFDVGSTSKQFTAACIGLLEQDGVLTRDDDIHKWVSEVPDFGSTITLRHLLNHTSGLRDYLHVFAEAGRRTEDWTTSEQALAAIAAEEKLEFEPGTKHRYSNSGYFLLSLVVERASGVTLAQFAEKRLFTPLEMRSTHFHDDHTFVVPRRATAHSPREGGGFGIAMSDFEQTGDGGVMTTVGDLAKWDANFYSRKIGGDALQAFLHERGKLADGRELRYAAGLFVDEFQGHKRVSHGGAWAGYRAELMRFPDDKLTVMCLANVDALAPTKICERIAEHALAVK